MSVKKLFQVNRLLDNDRSIGFGYIVNNLNGMDDKQVIDFFENRINYFYIKPAKFILKRIRRKWRNKKHTSNYGFVLIAFSSILIDTLSQYRYGQLISGRSIFKQFLRDYIPEFKNTFLKPGFIYEEDDMLKSPKKGNSIDFAELFYKGFRCGVVHNGKILSYGGYVYKQKSFIEEFQWNDGKLDRLVMSINPVVLFRKIETAFEKYLDELRNNLYKTEFYTKFKFDFGFIL